MAWRVARSLDQLLSEINASAPHRSKASDGSIGDEAHQGTDSDHNPWCQGWVVTARDFTHDPAGGFDAHAFADWLQRRCKGEILINGQREIRCKYIISMRRIASPGSGWTWQSYTGSNPHDKHVHVSVDCTAEGGYMDSVQPWGWPPGGGSVTDPEQVANAVWYRKMNRTPPHLADGTPQANSGPQTAESFLAGAWAEAQTSRKDTELIYALIKAGVPVTLSPAQLQQVIDGVVVGVVERLGALQFVGQQPAT